LAAEAGPVILPYTGGPTSSGGSSSILGQKQEQLEDAWKDFPRHHQARSWFRPHGHDRPNVERR
jgi:hypothetical protein